MEHVPNAQDLINTVASIFPAFVIVFMVGLGLGLMRHIHRAIKDIVDSPILALQEKPKNSDLLWPEKPKNDQVHIGDDGELVYGDPHQEGEPGVDPMFHRNN